MKKPDFKALFGDIDPANLSEAEIGRYIEKWNDRPIDDFCGLCSVQMGALLYETLGSFSPIRVRQNIDQDVFDGMPFFRLAEELLRLLAREEEVKLTATGALPRRFVHELYEMRILPQDDIEHGISKLSKEADWMALQGVLIVAEAAGLIRKPKKRMSLTRKGKELLKEEMRRDLFIEILQTFTGKLNWAWFDLYGNNEIGRYGWGYTAFLLLLFGEKPRPVEFYADLYRRAFPMLYSDEPQPGLYPTPPFKRFVNCYGLRSFSRFFVWFGWVEEKPKQYVPKQEDIVTANRLLWEVFETDGRKE